MNLDALLKANADPNAKNKVRRGTSGVARGWGYYEVEVRLGDRVRA